MCTTHRHPLQRPGKEQRAPNWAPLTSAVQVVLVVCCGAGKAGLRRGGGRLACRGCRAGGPVREAELRPEPARLLQRLRERLPPGGEARASGHNCLKTLNTKLHAT